jgi:sialic acid synthase SpsE
VRKFDVPVGFSDHTLGNEAAIAAAARGARIIEKHLTLDRSRPGPDHHASLEPREFRDMVAAIRNIEVALGDGVKRPQPIEESVRVAARRSLVAARSLRAGSIFHSEDVASKRPGTGISPADLARVVGRRLLRDVRADALIGWDDLGPIENSK